MRETILIDALERIEEMTSKTFNDTYINDIATKALSDYASQKEGLETPSQIFFRHLDKQRKKGDALLFKHIEPVIYAAMEEYAAQFRLPSSAPESGQKEGLRWVKASENENLPIAGKSVICLYGPKGLDKWEVVFADRRNISFLVMGKNGFDVKWLDESSAPESGGEDEENIRKFLREKRVIRAHNQDSFLELIQDYNNWRKDFVPIVQSSDVKEEGKDEEIKKMENIIDSASTAIDNQTKEIERLTAENEGNKTIAIERGKGIEELQGEIERLKNRLKGE